MWVWSHAAESVQWVVVVHPRRRHAKATAARLARVAGLVTALATWSATSVAAADEDGVVLQKRAPRLPRAEHQPVSGLVLKLGREVDWSRLSLAEDLPLLEQRHPLVPGVSGFLQGIDTRDAAWAGQPRAVTSMASAIGQLATGGLPLFEIWQNRRLRQRHFLRPYFKSNGLKLVWKIEF